MMIAKIKTILLAFTTLAAAGTFYSCSKDEPIKPMPPGKITTLAATDIHTTSAITGATFEGDNSVTAKGMCWSESAAPTTEDSKTNEGGGPGSFTSSLTDLSPGVTYHVRSYAINDVGTTYGSEITFTTPTPDVYIAGEQMINLQWVATYWKNGVATSLTDGTNPAYGSYIGINGNNVYVFYVENVGKRALRIWNNGTITPLTDGTYQANARGFKVFGDDVYALGTELNASNKLVAKYWKNGVVNDLTDGTQSATVYDMLVSGNDIFFVGDESNGTKQVAKYWKNGVAYELTDGTQHASAYSIVSDGTNIYIGGMEYDATGTNRDAKYWKNGEEVVVGVPGKTTAILDMELSGDDVYMVGVYSEDGSNYDAVMWQNENLLTLSDPSMLVAEANYISIVAGQVYVMGDNYDNGFKSMLWVNGQLQAPFDGTSTSPYGRSMCIVDK